MAVGPTPGKEQLGLLVREIMRRNGSEDVVALAKAARVSRDTIYNLLSGNNKPRWNNFLAILTAIDASSDEVHSLSNLYEIADDERVAIKYASELSPQYLRYRRWESEAKLEQTIDTFYIPGPYQTAEYAEAAAESSPGLIVRPSWKEIAAADRNERQELLYLDEPLHVASLIDESAVRRIVGSPAVMKEQLARLLDRASMPNVDWRIMPFRAGPYGVHGGAVTLLTPRNVSMPVEGWIDSGDGLTLLKPERVQAYSAVWDAAFKLALSAEESAEVVREIRRKL